MSLFDFLFPKRCVNCRKFGSYVCATCFTYISFLEHGVCVVCQKPAIFALTHPGCKKAQTIDGIFSSLVYAGVVKKLVYTFKYKPHLTHMQEMLVDLMHEGLIQREAFYSLLQIPSVLMPIPLFHSRLKTRGYNQSMLLAQGLGKRLGISVVDGLARVRNTHTQVGLTQLKRQENIRGAFAVKKGYEANVPQVFLLDDVATSGATLAEAAKMLKKAGVGKVWGVTLAHGQ